MANREYRYVAGNMHDALDKTVRELVDDGFDINELKKLIKTAYKRRIRRLPDDALELPLWHSTRRRTTGDESMVEYGFVSREEVEEYPSAEECVRDLFEVRNDSPYDCSGRFVTGWLHWHENPDGSVSVVHHMFLDI